MKFYLINCYLESNKIKYNTTKEVNDNLSKLGKYVYIYPNEGYEFKKLPTGYIDTIKQTAKLNGYMITNQGKKAYFKDNLNKEERETWSGTVNVAITEIMTMTSNTRISLTLPSGVTWTNTPEEFAIIQAHPIGETLPEPTKPEPEPEPDPEPKETLVNATINGSYNYKEAIKDEYNISIRPDDGYYFNPEDKENWIEILGKKCYLKEGDIFLSRIDSSYRGVVHVYVYKDLIEIEPPSSSRLHVISNNAYIRAIKNGDSEEPKEPENPEPEEEKPKGIDYPKETLINCYIDEWRVKRDSETKEVFRDIEKYTSFKDWLNLTAGIIKGDVNFQANNGYDFGLDYNDGYIILNDDTKLTFYEMYEQAEPAGDYEIQSKNYTYKNTKIYYIDKGKNQYLRFLSYTKNKIYIYFNNGFTMGINDSVPMLDDPPFNSILKSVIKEIYVNAYIENKKSVTNLAYDSYIITDKQLSKIRENNDLYNDIIINTYNYPLLFDDEDLIDTEFSIDSASFNVVTKKFTQVTTEIPIFEFDIPYIKNVKTVELYPIFANKILLDYNTIKGKHIKGVSVYDCLTNTNVLKILANGILVDYYEYNIQSEIPVNYNIASIRATGTIGRRIPLFKSFIIIQSSNLVTINDDNNFYNGNIEKFDSTILKQEFELLEQLFRNGIYVNEVNNE